MPFSQMKDDYQLFDFTEINKELLKLDLNKEQEFSGHIFNKMAENSKDYGIGKYNEDRFIYKRSAMFSDEESRSVHLGIDIWAPAGTAVFAPLDGVVHSFANNNQHGDYGPTIILKHELDGVEFHTLYGHLSKKSILDLKVGTCFKKGTILAEYGNYEENVHWPPHLHFQIVENMGDKRGDYPGVCKPSEKEDWLSNCPDPNLILNIDGL